MIQMTPQMRILVAVEAVDFRKGIDGLARVCQEQLKGDPFSGGLFVFRNRSGTSVKILVYDGRGFWLCQKRLSSGRFRFWPTSPEGASLALEAHEAQVLLAGGDPASAPGSPLWRRVDPPGSATPR
jgi:transposase